MTVLKSFFVMSVIVTLLAAVALVQLVITLLPYLAAALIVALILRWRRSKAPAAVAAASHAVRICPDSEPSYRIGAPAAAPGGWVMVPVWVAPRRADPNVIDGEVITGRD
jgi:hypothetical protein